MKHLVLFVVAPVALGILACSAEDRPRLTGDQNPLVTHPDQLPDFCPLAWSSPPRSMEADGDGADLLKMISGFWFGDAQPSPTPGLRSAISNIYSMRGGDPDANPLVIVSFFFVNRASAVAAETRLHQRFGESTAHRFGRYGEVIVVLGRKQPVSEECADWFWSRIDTELRAAV